MKPLWLIGANVASSPSPAMHNAALDALGHGTSLYSARPTSPAELSSTLDAAERECRGINVTAPHKVAVAQRYAGVLDDDARAAGAVNTVVYDDHGRAAVAGNTDVAGLLFAWRRSALHFEGRTIGVVGAGGAARAVVVAAKQAGARSLVIHARKMSDAVALVDVAARIGIDAAAAEEPCGASVAVFAASAIEDAGAWLDRVLEGPGAVHDLRYGVAARNVRDAALARGCVFADGTLMLLAQAQAALARFTGAPVPDSAATAMRRALTATMASAVST